MKVDKKILLFFFGICLVFYYKIIFTDFTYFQRDVIKQFKPWKTYITKNLANISNPGNTYLDYLPLWNHYNHCGAPLIANLQSQVFYPLSIVFYLLDFATGYKIFILWHSIFAMIFMYLYLKSKNLDEPSAIVGGIIWSFNGYMISRIEFLSVFATIIWLPLIVLLFEKTFINIKPTMKDILLLSLTLSVQFLAGHIQMWSYTVGFLLLYSFVIDIKRKNLFPTVITILSVCIALCISGIQFLPTIEFFYHSTRAGEKELGIFGMDFLSSTVHSLKWEDLKNFFYPFYWTIPAFDTKKVLVEIAPYWIHTFYLGFVSMFISILGWFNKKLKYKFFWLITILIYLFYALGKNFYFFPIFYTFFPPIRIFRYPGTATYIPVFVLCVVASYGIDVIVDKIKYIKPNFFSTEKILPILSLSVGLVIFVELFIYNHKMSLVLPKEILYYHPESVKFLSQLIDDKLYRFSLTPKTYFEERSSGITLYHAMQIYRDKLYGNLNLEYDLYNFYGQDIELRNFRKFLDLTFSQKSLDDAIHLFAIANVKYILSTTRYSNLNHAKLVAELPNSGIMIYENPYVLERIYFVSEWLNEPNITKSCKILSKIKFEILNTAILHSTEYLSTKKQKLVQYSIENVNLQLNKLSFDITCSDDGLVVISQNFYPGWKCKVNNITTKLLPANIFMTAIPVSKGYHKIELVYDPLSFKLGCILTLISIFFILLYFFETQNLLS